VVGLAIVLFLVFRAERVDVVSREPGLDDAPGAFSVVALGQVGVGQGGQWHLAPNLADAIVLFYFRPETGVVNLVSLPRDLYGNLGEDRIKINRVLLDKKLPEFLKVLPDITGIKTERYMIFDLNLVKGIVDSLGGVDVNLPTAVHDPVGDFSLNSGSNHLGGESAVWLIRNRYAPTGDFFREQNQHLVVEAVLTKFSQLSALEKTSFIFRVLPHLSSDMSNFSLNEVASNFRDAEVTGFNSIVLDFSTGLWQSSSILTEDGESAYVLIPKEGINEYRAIREYIEQHLE